MPTDIPVPTHRRLRGYAIDPSLGLSLATMEVNELVYKVAWEQLQPRSDQPGASYPRGEYIEIVDYDPSTGKFYEPVNLDDPYLLAQDGFEPSVGSPEFHQQMVYAVIMTTIGNFERALGRKILWAENIPTDEVIAANGDRKTLDFEFVQQLRIYPHALRQANAFYDPNRKAILFGYFQARPASPSLQLPGSTVFTCLSHDIIAHEMTHAILDGLHRRYIRATHPDTRAFHEAFADIVALFQHFTFPEVLRHQIALTRGDLKRQNLLGQLAQQFGYAIGSYGSLRDAIGYVDPVDQQWKPHVPNPHDYQQVMECHQRGSILVAAIFDAFLNIYQHRVRRIMRIATGGTGILPAGDLHPDLVEEMAKTASDVASDVLRICIRALDYCPPMDLTFGDYLRALITADSDMVSDDKYGYRVAFVEAFQKRGISVAGVRSMAVEELVHPLNPIRSEFEGAETDAIQKRIVDFLRELKNDISYLKDRREIYTSTKALIAGTERMGLHRLVAERFDSANASEFTRLTGLLFPGNKRESEKLGMEFGYIGRKTASYAVGNVWLANRVTPDGRIVNHVVVTLAQKRGVRFDVDGNHVTVIEDQFFVPDKTSPEDMGENSIIFGGGCTLIFDLDQMKLRYAVKKDIDDRDRMIRQFKFEHGMLSDETSTYFSNKTMNELAGPFAFMHSHTPMGDHHAH